MNATDIRERLIEQLEKALALTREDGKPSAENERRFDSHLAEVQRLWDRLSAVAGLEAPESARSIEGMHRWLTERSAGADGPGYPLPGTAVHGGGRRPAISGLGPSWYDGMVRGGRLHAGLVDPSGGSMVAVPVRTSVIVDPRRGRFVRELIPEEPAPNGMYAYLRQTVRTFNATAVARLARKPTSTLTLKRIEDRTRTIAHLTEPIARQDLADAAALREFIDDELRLGLYLELDREIVAGDGSGEALTGFLEAGVGNEPFGSDVLVTTRSAITTLQKLEVVPTAWAINPDDWEAIELAAMETFAASTAQTAPGAVMDQRLWSVPVLVTNAVPAGRALLGDFAGSAVLHATGQVRIDWSENVFDPDFESGTGATDFERNAIRFRAEGRWGLAVTRPLAFVAVEVSAGS